MILALGLVFGIARGMNYGIDFTGGTMIQMDMGKTVKTTDVEKAIKEYKLDPEIIYSGEGNKEIVIRTIKSLDSDQRAKVISTINENFGTTDDDVVAEELFGPSVGKELRNNAFLAVLIAGICMLVYIRFRFSPVAVWRSGASGRAARCADRYRILCDLQYHDQQSVHCRYPYGSWLFHQRYYRSL